MLNKENKCKIILYSTSGCHLCDEAKAVLAEAQIALSVELNVCEVDIADSEKLMALYGVRIPVVVFKEGGKDLAWPFTVADFLVFLRNEIGFVSS